MIQIRNSIEINHTDEATRSVWYTVRYSATANSINGCLHFMIIDISTYCVCVCVRLGVGWDRGCIPDARMTGQ